MNAPRYVFKGTAELVPTEQEVAARLGPEFVAVVERKMAEIARSIDPQAVAQIGANLQGMYYTAALFDRLDKRLVSSYLQVVIARTRERLEQLSIRSRVAKPNDLKAQVP